MDKSMLHEINRLRQMTVAELQIEWQRLYGEPSRSRNRDFLWRRLSWRLQELQLGGLSDRARSRIEELAPPAFERARTPVVAQTPKVTRIREAKQPTPGTVIIRQYCGQEIRVTTLDDGFEWDGRVYSSLSAVAYAVTGAKWNGRLFFGLVDRKRK